MNPRDEAIQLIKWFMEYEPTKLSDYSWIEWPTAKAFANKLVEEKIKLILLTKDKDFIIDNLPLQQQIQWELEKL